MKGFQWKDGYEGEHWFAWSTAPEGHELVGNDRYTLAALNPEAEVNSVDAKPPWLVRKNRTLRAPALPPYSPLKMGDLHRKFVQLRNDEELLAFADTYGLLTPGVALASVGGGEVVYGESLAQWHEELRAMGSVVQIWDWAAWDSDAHSENPSAGKLGQVFTWLRNGKVVYRMKTRPFHVRLEPRVFPARKGEAGYSDGVLSDGQRIEPALVQLVKPGELTKLGRYYVCREVNRRLRRNVSPQLLPFSEDIRDVHLFPENLVTALWVMLMKEIAGQTKIRRCPLCGDKFEVKGSRDKYCSPAHKTKAWEDSHPEWVAARRERRLQRQELRRDISRAKKGKGGS